MRYGYDYFNFRRSDAPYLKHIRTKQYADWPELRQLMTYLIFALITPTTRSMLLSAIEYQWVIVFISLHLKPTTWTTYEWNGKHKNNWINFVKMHCNNHIKPTMLSYMSEMYEKASSFSDSLHCCNRTNYHTSFAFNETKVKCGSAPTIHSFKV